jgi:4'-phosphopantetheinyl transferase
MIEVYYLICSGHDVPDDEAWLSPGERATLSRLSLPKRRQDWQLGRWTAKRALGAAWPAVAPHVPLPDLEIVAAPDGAPELLGSSPAHPVLSLSHSAGWGLCAVARAGTRLGCDVEQVGDRSRAFVEDYFTEAERARVWAEAEVSRGLWATLIWSAKESALKARRTGLRADTRSVTVDLSGSPDDRTWQPLVVHTDDGCVLRGWWLTPPGRVMTLVSTPDPGAPIPLG